MRNEKRLSASLRMTRCGAPFLFLLPLLSLKEEEGKTPGERKISGDAHEVWYSGMDRRSAYLFSFIFSPSSSST